MNIHKRFKSTRAFAAFVQDALADKRKRIGYFDRRESVARGVDVLLNGDETNVPRARALLKKLQSSVEVPHRTWQHSQVGAFPDVPAFLSNTPEPMWHLAPVYSDRTPLRVFVGLTSSAGVSEQELADRGVTLAAFAIAMSEKRPVYITPYVNLGILSYSKGRSGPENALASWDVHTSPFVMSELLGCLSNPYVTRHVGIAACYALNPSVSGGWHDDYNDEAAMRKHLGAAPTDLYLPSIHLHDQLRRDPVGWIKDKVAQYGNEE